MSAVKVVRSTVNGTEQTSSYYDRTTDEEREVPSYVVLAGSLNDAAKSLGLRILGRRESGVVVAELHEQGEQGGAGSYWAVQS